MSAPLLGIRLAALIFAALNGFGLLYFSDVYFTHEQRGWLLVSSVPILALIVGGLVRRSWYRAAGTRFVTGALYAVGTACLILEIYEDLTLVNGADWPAAVLRMIEIALLLVFAFLAVRRGQFTSLVD